MPRSRKPRQMTLEATLGQARAKVRAPRKLLRPVLPPESPSAAAAAKQAQPSTSSPQTSRDDEDEIAFDKDVEADDDDEDVFVRRGSQARGARASRKPASRKIAFDDDDDDEEDHASDQDDMPVASRRAKTLTPRKRVSKRARSPDDDDDDDDDLPLLPTSSATNVLPSSSPAKRRRYVLGSTQPNKMVPSSSSLGAPQDDLASSPAKPRRPRTEKERKRELLRRLKAGETRKGEEESSGSDEDERKPMYDSDSDSNLAALDDFFDDDEGVLEEPSAEEVARANKRKKDKSRARARSGSAAAGKGGKTNKTGETAEESISVADSASEDDDSSRDSSDDEADAVDEGVRGERDSQDLDGFVVIDDGTALDEARQEIPIEFTSRNHKKLDEHFYLCVEWLVSFKINPYATETRRTPDYISAWGKLERAVAGLADSKFTSSAWRSDFHRALRARPTIESFELVRGADLLHDGEDCGACGRRNHPAKFRVQFLGQAYHQKSEVLDTFLRAVDQDEDSDDEDRDDGAASDTEYDEDNNPIPRKSKEWYVGSVCHANAETAHMLVHWKHALLEWVDDRLTADGYMAQLPELAKKSHSALERTVNEIMTTWRGEGTLRSLWNDFKRSQENAQNQSTTGRPRRGRR